MSNALDFGTVGELRYALNGLTDEQIIIAQVVAADGSAWNMRGTLAAFKASAVLTLSHPYLATLPPAEFVSAPPEDGRPTYAELVEALRDLLTDVRFAEFDPAARQASDLLARIPKEEG